MDDLLRGHTRGSGNETSESLRRSIDIGVDLLSLPPPSPGRPGRPERRVV